MANNKKSNTDLEKLFKKEVRREVRSFTSNILGCLFSVLAMALGIVCTVVAFTMPELSFPVIFAALAFLGSSTALAGYVTYLTCKKGCEVRHALVNDKNFRMEDAKRRRTKRTNTKEKASTKENKKQTSYLDKKSEIVDDIIKSSAKKKQAPATCTSIVAEALARIQSDKYLRLTNNASQDIEPLDTPQDEMGR